MTHGKPFEIPPKPEGSIWTEEQWRAIAFRGENALVTAGAGSGKTRVLVERVLQMISDEDAPVDIDRLLVVTFTNAAAAEMKQRIGVALEKAIKEKPYLTHLRRQLLLLNKASISTVHSFCLEVIKNYYYLQDLNPSFRVLDETEAELLRQEVLEEVLEEYYDNEEAESPFYRLVDIYSSDRGDNPLQLLVRRLYDFSRSHTQPAAWLQKNVDAFRIEDVAELEQNPWVQELLWKCGLRLESIMGQLQEAVKIAQMPRGPAPYEESLRASLETVKEIREIYYSNSWQDLFMALQEPVFGRFSSCTGDLYDPLLKNQATKMRDNCKAELKKIKEELFQRPLDEQLEDLKRLVPLLEALVDLVLSFGERYREAKSEKGFADFSDLEHYALQILSQPDTAPDSLQPSEAALEYRKKFAGVLVDEYQDINLVQEAILNLVSRPGPGGNLFMVGDVKQSIYRFRLAEPELFLRKMRNFTERFTAGECIALTRNFRSRSEILAGVNFLFNQIMDEKIGEIEYDQKARLYYGASYPPVPEEEKNPFAVEAVFISAEGEDNDDDATLYTQPEVVEELEMASLEGRLLAKKIKELLGEDGNEPLFVLDRETEKQRPVRYRDMVILLRSTPNLAVPILEELRLAGIPAYAELGTGYFEAIEVEVMLSLLQIIDNSFQEIPLVAVLRSPLVGLSAEELAQVRTAAPGVNYYEALQHYCADAETSNNPIRKKLQSFLQDLRRWQDQARQGSLADLIWQIYSDTGYYDLVGGMPGGNQRQANLRALYDRARQYEAASLRGLFRFLRFIEKLKERGGDLEAARALGEQENVVRIITVHKSKGLEFPVVFVAGLAKKFNFRDMQQNFLLHKELGFGPKFVDTELRLVYPTLPWFALESRLLQEMLAEEMRVLYVALTRAKEKLILVASVKDMGKKVLDWEAFSRSEQWLLPSYYRAGVRNFLDWIGPALLRHPQAAVLHELQAEKGQNRYLKEKESSSWNIQVLYPQDIIGSTDTAQEEGPKRRWQENVLHLKPVPLSTKWAEEVSRRLSWRYPYPAAQDHFAKMSVTELGKLLSAGLAGEDATEAPWFKTPVLLSMQGVRPRFLGKGGLTPAERGTAYHTVMQHLEFGPSLDERNVVEQLEDMVVRELLTEEEKMAIDPKAIVGFFQTALGQQVCTSPRVEREIPFSMILPAKEVYPDWPESAGTQAGNSGDNPADNPGDNQADDLGNPADNINCNREGSLGSNLDDGMDFYPDICPGDERVLIQGVIDCLVWDDDGMLIIDYKTDNTTGLEIETLKNRYRQQLELYSHAVKKLRKAKVKGKYLYFFDRRQVLELK